MFKAGVALEASKGEESSAGLASRFDIRPGQIIVWGIFLLEDAAGIFGGDQNTPHTAGTVINHYLTYIS